MRKIIIGALLVMTLQLVLGLQFGRASESNCNVIGCVQCPDPNVCLHCDQAGHFNPEPSASNTCECAKGNYQLKDKCLSCLSAHPHCLQCTYNGALCTVCSMGFYLQKGNCPSCGNNCQVCSGPSKCDKCMSGSRWNGTICESCGINDCQTCTKANECDKCTEGHFLKVTSILGRKTYTCNKCSDNCLLCSDATNCSNCKVGFYLNGNKCLSCQSIQHCLECKTSGSCSKCADTFYQNGNLCSSCQTPENHCLNCYSPSSCTSCITQQYYVSQSSCKKCIDSFQGCVTCKIVNSDAVCLTCQPSFFLDKQSCKLCSIFDTHCIQCNNNQQCTKCFGDNNFFIKNGQCQSCSVIPNCWTCASETNCLTCVDRFYIKVQDQCLSCSQLIDDCSQCSSAQQCNKCNFNFFLDDNTCKACQTYQVHCQTCLDQTHCQTCIKGFYSNTDQVCIGCSSLGLDCVECSNQGKCTRCKAGKYLNDQSTCSSCMSDCSLCQIKDTCDTCRETFGLNNKNGCQSCSVLISHCNKCKDFTSCSECQDSSFKIKQKCFTCEQLFPSCSSCTLQTCSKCKDGYDLTNNDCKQTSSSSTAKIIVGVIGGVAALALGGFLIYRKLNRKKLAGEGDKEPTVNQTIITQSQDDERKQNLID